MAAKKLTDYNILEAQTMYERGGNSLVEIANTFGVSDARICMIAKKLGWQRQKLKTAKDVREERLLRQAAMHKPENPPEPVNSLPASEPPPGLPVVDYTPIPREALVEAAGIAQADLVLSHRALLQRQRWLIATLTEQVASDGSPLVARIESAKKLVDAAVKLIQMERYIHDIRPPEDDNTADYGRLSEDALMQKVTDVQQRLARLGVVR